MLEASLRLGTIRGIRIGVHYTWFVIFLLLTLSLSSIFQASQEGLSKSTALLTAAVTSLTFFGSIILHELGHSLVAIARGIPVRAITLFIFGGVAQTEKDADSASTEFWVAIAGPIVSFVLAGVFYLLAGLAEPFSAPAALGCNWLARINLIVAVFNLLPGFPLDGGRVFRAIVWGVTGNATRGMRWAFVAGRGVAHGLILLGLLVVITTGLILNGLWLAAIGWFLLTAVEASSRDFTLRRTLHGVVASDVMQSEIPKVPASLSILDWIDQHVLNTGQRSCLVTENGRVVGLVTLTDSRKVVREEWARRRVRDVMTPAREFRVVAPGTPVMEVLQLMQRYSFNQVPVSVDGEIEGWIDRNRLLQIVQLHIETGR